MQNRIKSNGAADRELKVNKKEVGKNEIEYGKKSEMGEGRKKVKNIGTREREKEKMKDKKIENE